MATGIMSADEREIGLLLDNLIIEKSETRLGKKFYQGTLAGQQVVLTTSGIGKARAAARTQFLIDRFHIERLIFLGVAGALSPGVRQGNVVVSSRVREHDFDLGPSPAGEMQSHWYEADPQLIDLALEAGRGLGMADQLHLGSIVTGDQAILDAERKQYLWQAFGADCVEMEGAAVGMVCWLNQVPFVLVRGISDLADQNAVEDVQRWFREAADRSARVVLEMLKALPAVSRRSGEGLCCALCHDSL